MTDSSCTPNNLAGFSHRPVELLWNSGSPAHFVNDKTLLCDCRSELDRTSFFSGHFDNPLEVLGVGFLIVKLRNGMVFKLTDVKYTKGLAYNMISQVAAMKEGFDLFLHSLKLYTDDKLTDCVSRLTEDKLTVLDSIVLTPNYFPISNITFANSDGAYLVHCRLGHPTVKHQRMLVKAYPEATISAPMNLSCTACAQANKLEMTPRCMSVDVIATRPLERILANVNFTSVESITGARMWLAIVDRYSEYVEVFTLKSIPKALGKVVAFIRQAEQLLPGKPKCKFVRAEHGDEFMGALERYCERSGIVYQRHLRYASNQDGPVEMVLHGLEKVAVALLEHAALPEVLWPYALQMAAMYHNFTVSAATLRVPVEDFIGQKVEFPTFRVFGCTIVATIPKMYRDDTSSPGVEGAYLGPSLSNKGCLMFEKNTGKIYEVDLVKFFEERMFFKENPWYPSEILTRKHESEYSALEPLFKAIVQRENLLRSTANHTILRPNVVPRTFDYRKLFTVYDPDLNPDEETNSDFDLEPDEEATIDYYLEMEEETTADEARAKRHCPNNRNIVVKESTASSASQQNDEIKCTESAGPRIWSVKSMLRKVVENRYGIFAGGEADDQVHEDMDNGTESNGGNPTSIDQVVSEINRIRSGDSELLITNLISHDIDHPVSFRELMDLEESELWREVCYSEIRSHKEYGTFE